MQPVAGEVRGRLTDERRPGAREVRRVVARDVGVVVGEVGADQFAVHPLEVVVRLAVAWVDDEVEVAGAHPERAQPLCTISYGPRIESAVSTVERWVCALAHDLHPADVLAGARRCEMMCGRSIICAGCSGELGSSTSGGMIRPRSSQL